MAYRRCGKCPPLVMVQGTPDDNSRWRPVLPALEERFTVTYRSVLPHSRLLVLEGQGYTAVDTGTDLSTAEVLLLS